MTELGFIIDTKRGEIKTDRTNDVLKLATTVSGHFKMPIRDIFLVSVQVTNLTFICFCAVLECYGIRILTRTFEIITSSSSLHIRCTRQHHDTY